MKKFITLSILILLTFPCFSQTYTSTILKDTIVDKIPEFMQPKAGSCGSPDGGMNSIPSPPPSYNWLENNGYCNPDSYGTNPTVCWTFTPSSSSVSINSGYSVTGCVNVSFGSFNLYNNVCTLIGTGLNFTGLVVGQQYTWCMTGSAWGGGFSCAGFDDFCPYFINNVVIMPIELINFYGENTNRENIIQWSTASEYNSSHFILLYSTDGKNFIDVIYTPGQGNTTKLSEYKIKHFNYEPKINYYKLVQVDYDGYKTEYGPISINNMDKNKIVKVVNMFGQIVDENAKGILFEIHENGDIVKIFK